MHHNLRISLVFGVLLTVLILPGHLCAQSPNFQNSVVHVQHDPPSMGRDLWFSLLTNYAGNTGNKFFALYITSPKATTAWVQLGSGTATALPIVANKTTTYNMPLSWELQKSGVVEQKAVHVWSKDADLCCYVMSHNDQTSDGFYVYPMIGWGKEYVVAGYSAMLAGRGSSVADEPSEFAIVSSRDSTSVTIIPSMDIRMEGAVGASCDQIFARKGVPTRIILNRGESMQCKTTCTQECPWDLTGTAITSTKPIGVVCGSQCPFIPCDFGYCDHICEMVPPTRTWAMTYYSIPFVQPAGASKDHSASTFVVISSKPNQNIYRVDTSGVPKVHCTLSSAFESYERNDIIEASKWFSDAPFLLVQYINAASYPDNINGNGDPAEVVVSGAEQYFRTSVFQLPVLSGNSGAVYRHYVNIIANASDTNVFLDTIALSKTHATNVTRLQIDGKYVGYRVANLATGSSHIVTSDSGAGVYIYGYGFDESYAYSGPMGTATLNSPDSTPLLTNTSANGSQMIVSLSDTASAGGIYYIRADSLQNAVITFDSNYAEGNPVGRTSYRVSAADPSSTGVANVSVFTMGGSRSTITTRFDAYAGTGHITPLAQYVVAFKDSTVYLYDTIVNTSSLSLPVSDLALRFGDRGFRIDSAVTTTLEGGAQRIVRIAFHPTSLAQSSDTLVLGNMWAAVSGTMSANESVDGKSVAAVAVSVEGRLLKMFLDVPAHIDLFTEHGATALSADLPANGQLDLTSLVPSAYFYRLAYSGKTITGKIVIPQ